MSTYRYAELHVVIDNSGNKTLFLQGEMDSHPIVRAMRELPGVIDVHLASETHTDKPYEPVTPEEVERVRQRVMERIRADRVGTE
jgi:hypothetical protein